MKKLKSTLLAVSAVCVIAGTALTATSLAAAEGYRDVTLTGTNVFYAGVGGASIAVTRISDDSEEGYTDYTSFLIGEDENITYRKNLAYSWYSAGENGGGVHNNFSMTVGFTELNFESFAIRMQSQQYALTEDGVSENYILFAPEDDALKLYVSSTESIDDARSELTLESYAQIELSFGGYANGDYVLYANGEEAGTIENVRENYASYVSSGDTAATPLRFSATFAEDASEDEEAEMIMYELNNQSFRVYDATIEEDSQRPTGGTIRDDQAPVVCLNSNVNYLTFGEEVDIDYTTIDVIASSPRTSVRYYVLTYEQYGQSDFNYNDTEAEDLFLEVTTSSDYVLLRDPSTYVPELTDSGIVVNDRGYKTYGLAKVYLYVRDTTASNAQTDIVFIDWYVPAEYVYDIKAGQETTAEGSNFIRIVEDLEGASYTKTGELDFSDYPAEGENADDIAAVSAEDFTIDSVEKYEQYIRAIEAYYQYKIDSYIEENYPDGLYASSESNLYLPDFAGYIADNLGGYTDLSYNIYYSYGTTGSTSALDYNELALTVSQADVTYRFTVYATDAADNPMRYVSNAAGEEIAYTELSSDDIWEEDNASLLPFFEVSVSYKSATVEEPDIQDVGYVGSTYNSVSFDITGVSGTYSTDYKLYIFDRDEFYNRTGIRLTYDDVVANVNALFNNTYPDAENTRQYFTLVTDDEKYEDYEWNSSNVTFVPQDPSELYVVRLTLTDTGLTNQKTDSFLVVRASARANELYGEDDWLENNVAAIVLFSIAGVCLVAFVILLIVKPKDKGDIDVIAVEAEEKKNKKSKKS